MVGKRKDPVQKASSGKTKERKKGQRNETAKQKGRKEAANGDLIVSSDRVAREQSPRGDPIQTPNKTLQSEVRRNQIVNLIEKCILSSLSPSLGFQAKEDPLCHLLGARVSRFRLGRVVLMMHGAKSVHLEEKGEEKRT